MKNLYDTQAPLRGETFETLFDRDDIRIVKIVSSDTPEDIVYIQDEDEWAALLSGDAVIELDGKTLRLKAGDTLYIPAQTPHRLLSVAKGSRWLTFHFVADKNKFF